MLNIRHLGELVGPRNDIVALVWPQVEAWTKGVRTLTKIVAPHPQMVYAVMGMFLQLYFQYLQRTAKMVGTLMEPIKRYLGEALLPSMGGGGGGSMMAYRISWDTE